jgi:hypothetical protein
MVAISAETLLACWEQGRMRHPLDRALLLHAVAAPELDPESLADRPVGRRNAALLALRRSLFGDELKSCVDCPECGEKLEFSLSANAMLARAGACEADIHDVNIGGVRLRLPTSRDLAQLAGQADEQSASRALLQRLSDGELTEWSAELETQIASAFDAADPCLDLAIGLDCPACGHAWSAPFDVARFLWEEIEVRARRLLDEVHALARSYAWSEKQILELSESRRRAYLERVLA